MKQTTTIRVWMTTKEAVIKTTAILNGLAERQIIQSAALDAVMAVALRHPDELRTELRGEQS